MNTAESTTSLATTSDKKEKVSVLKFVASDNDKERLKWLIFKNEYGFRSMESKWFAAAVSSSVAACAFGFFVRYRRISVLHLKPSTVAKFSKHSAQIGSYNSSLPEWVESLKSATLYSSIFLVPVFQICIQTYRNYLSSFDVSCCVAAALNTLVLPLHLEKLPLAAYVVLTVTVGYMCVCVAFYFVCRAHNCANEQELYNVLRQRHWERMMQKRFDASIIEVLDSDE